MEAAGVKEIITYMRSVASTKNKMRLTFRYIIRVLKKSAQLAWDDKSEVILRRHVKEAIEKHCIGPERQFMDRQMEKGKALKIVFTEGGRVGSVNGLYVTGSGDDLAGSVGPVDAWLKKVEDPDHARYAVTGVVKEAGSQVQDSIRDVQAAVFKLYGINLEAEYFVHMKFRQKAGEDVEGPSAGITQFLALASLLGDPRLPEDKRMPIKLRQDIAITGAMEITEASPDGDIRVSAIGGTNQKIDGAKKTGIRYVIIPKENYDNNFNHNITGVKVIGAATVLEYLDLMTYKEEAKDFFYQFNVKTYDNKVNV
jgi:predicted ATP-dependent protease